MRLCILFEITKYLFRYSYPINRYDEAEDPLDLAIYILDKELDESTEEGKTQQLNKHRLVLETQWTKLRCKQGRFAEAEERARKAAVDIENEFGLKVYPD